MKQFTRVFDRITQTWKTEEIEVCETLGTKETMNITDIKTYKPTLDSIRQMLGSGTHKIVGQYDYDEHGKKLENDRMFDNWQNVDISDVDKAIRNKTEELKTKVAKAKYKKAVIEADKKAMAEEEEARKILKDLIKGAVKESKD